MAGKRKIGVALHPRPQLAASDNVIPEPEARFNPHTGQTEPAQPLTPAQASAARLAASAAALSAAGNAAQRAAYHADELGQHLRALKTAREVGMARYPWYERWYYRTSDAFMIWWDDFLAALERALRGRP